MCGIAGAVDTRARSSAAELDAIARRMADALIHRGPDDGGTWTDAGAGVALGHRRLSILDLSPEGHQPMRSACGRFVIVYNGEVYNYRELRAELEKERAAPAWRGHSDTEVILAAIRHWGLDAALGRFVGMFAFALWDQEQRVLHLVRDRMGEKPLYYGWINDVFLFGSELKALRAHPQWRGEIDRNALALFLRHNYIPAPYSIYRNVYKLRPGTALTLRLDGSRTGAEPELQPASYWSVRQAAERGVAEPLAEADLENHLDRLLREAVAGQMVADVPLGAFLSGGVDSSTVVALMQAQSARPVKTFSIGFREAGYDEAVHAQAVACHLGTDHTELYVSPAEAMAVIPRLPALYDEPFSDSSQIPTFLVSQLARRHVTVSLSGDGGDELFGGYNRYFWGRRIWRNIGWMPRWLRGMLARGMSSVSPQSWDRVFQMAGPVLPGHLEQSAPGDKLHKLAEVLAVDCPESMYQQLVSHWKSPTRLVPGSMEPATCLTDRHQWARLPDFTLRMMFLDMISYLPDDILVKVDRASMGVSLESRVPLLDHRLVEFAWRVPLSLKLRGDGGKWLLRQVLHRYVPRELIDRPKMGFGIPIDSWLRGPMREWADALLDEKRLREEGFFAPVPIREKWAEHLSGKRNWQYYLWDVLMFQSWLAENAPGRVERH